MEHSHGRCGTRLADTCDPEAANEPSGQDQHSSSVCSWSIVSVPYYCLSLSSNVSSSVTITSIERLISLNFNATFILDFTWATGTSVIWTQVESTVGVICACTPSLRMPLARFIPFLFGTSKHNPSYELSDGVHGACPRSNNWNSQSTRSKRRDDFEVAIDDLETSYKSEGSQEQIMGIKKTVSIDMTFQERARESDAGSSKLYAI